MASKRLRSDARALGSFQPGLLGFRVQGLGFRVSGVRVKRFRFGVQGLTGVDLEFILKAWGLRV